jgi:3-oxoacyl-[acyl-carrier-protein] synthase-1
MVSTVSPRPPTPPAAPPRASDVVVTGTGMVSPVGSGAAQTATSVRAGLRRLREMPELYACLPEHPELDPPTPLVASAIAHLDTRARDEGRPAEWLGMLAGLAFADLDRRARVDELDPARVAVLLAMPAREGVGPEGRAELLYHFHNFAERDLSANVVLAFGGNATGLALLEQAAALVRERRFAAVAVGGADSWLFRPWLSAVDADWRLLSERNVDGFQPGEAAAFVLVEACGEAERRGVAPLASVGAFGEGRFERAKGLPNTGAELAGVLERVLPAAPPLVVCDLNGEAARAREWGFAISRLGRRLGPDLAVEHPASTLGDVGAATGVVLPALAVHHLRAKWADRAGAVVWAAAEDGERRAVQLERA